ncbi:MAG: STAS domain-containing protein, partial [Prevotella sp.]|nr:STAS domain-containing protein [Candidatus Prevotella equi]
MIYNLSGRIDTANAPQVDKQIQEAISNATEPVVMLTFDCSALTYISSTGLRIILKYKKLYPHMEVINVTNDVYSVFEMTGFSKIINVRKALRKINLEECTRLAHGANGEVYKINDEEIVKLSLLASVETQLVDEMNRAREAFILGVPTMISYEQVEVSDGRKGIVLEALNSTTLAQHLQTHPEELDDYVEPFVDLFRTTNAITAPEGKFSSAKQALKDCLDSPDAFLTEDLKDKVRQLIDAIPEGHNLIHGDGHLSNALLCGDEGQQSLMLIDMGDISTGHPIMEVMGMSFIMNGTEYSHARRVAPLAMGLDYDYVNKAFRKILALYLNITDAATLDAAVQAAAYVSVLRFICK